MSTTQIILPNDSDFEPTARRITAALNATRHLTTEQLEAGDLDYAGCTTLSDIRAALGVGDKPMLDELAGIVGTMKRERDEAVEALRDVLTLFAKGFPAPEIARARAALARIEGGRK